MSEDRFKELLLVYEEGLASRSELAELEGLLRESAERRRVLVERMRLNADLAFLCSSVESNAAAILDLQKEPHPEGARSALGPARRRGVWQRAAWACMAASVMAAALLAFLRGHTRVEIKGEYVRRGDAIIARTECHVSLADGSALTCSPGAEFTIARPEGGARQRIRLASGAVLVAVSKGTVGFEVASSGGTVTALGTKFTVEIVQGSQGGGAAGGSIGSFTRVQVLSGSVVLSNESGKLTLSFGEEGTLVSGKPPSKADADVVTASARMPENAVSWFGYLVGGEVQYSSVEAEILLQPGTAWNRTMKLTFLSTPSYPGIVFKLRECKQFQSDWLPYKALVLDFCNPEQTDCEIRVRIDDMESTDDYYEEPYVLKAGETTRIEVPLAGTLATRHGQRRTDPARMKKFFLFGKPNERRVLHLAGAYFRKE
jgi:ferric-dicitrate binding protein FerR (iron transport regulator)